MNRKLFDKLMEQKPVQHPSEWQIFLEICELHLKKMRIKNPIVVEIGSYRGKQKAFWQQLFNAEHYGIDISNKKGIPDIYGDSHNPKVLKILQKRLRGRSINILFIDASHEYKDVKKDFEIYSPLCSDIIALHDIEKYQYCRRDGERGVHRFWRELNKASYKEKGEHENSLFLSIHQCKHENKRRKQGIGVIIKR